LADARSALSSSLRIRALQDNAATCNETGQWGSGECVKAKKNNVLSSFAGQRVRPEVVMVKSLGSGGTLRWIQGQHLGQEIKRPRVEFAEYLL
jgi:hypothetical protein